MSAGVLIWAVVLSFLGINSALIAWFILRFTAGPMWALVGFNAVLMTTIYCVVQLIP